VQEVVVMTGEDRDARAVWVRPPGRGEIRPAPLPPVGPEEARVRTLRSAVSRGTEALVLDGHVPAGQYDLMRAPFQEGELPGPVKYGYLNVGTVEEGPASLRGRAVFCLYPHQTAYVVPAAALVPVPDEVPVTRAVLAGTVETAGNAVWDLGPLPGDRIAVVGAGMVGCCVARLLVQVPGVEVTLVDVDPARAATASALGVAFARPDDLGRPGGGPAGAGSHDAVVHTSATSAGLRLALELLAPDGEVLELSWYGDRPVEVALGGAFHSGRLAVRASQVGAVARSRRDRRTRHQRLSLAMGLLRDPAYDCLLTGQSRFDELPAVLPRLASGELRGLCHSITYEEDEACSA
jgi:NADPH:quinone reductase-like Zn-dependent oxidoreductase